MTSPNSLKQTSFIDTLCIFAFQQIYLIIVRPIKCNNNVSGVTVRLLWIRSAGRDLEDGGCKLCDIPWHEDGHRVSPINCSLNGLCYLYYILFFHNCAIFKMIIVFLFEPFRVVFFSSATNSTSVSRKFAISVKKKPRHRFFRLPCLRSLHFHRWNYRAEGHQAR